MAPRPRRPSEGPALAAAAAAGGTGVSRQGRRGGRRGGRDRAIRSALEDHEDHLQFVHVSLRPSLPLCLCLPTGTAGGRGQSSRAGPTHPAVGERGADQGQEGHFT